MHDFDDFDRYAATYDDDLERLVGWSGGAGGFARHKADYIARRLAPRRPRRVLDYGCGIGLLGVHLLDRLGPEAIVDGFDPSSDSLARVPRALRERGEYTEDLDALEAGGYDAVVIANVLHHVRPHARAELMSRAAGMLREGGRLCIFEHNPYNPATRRVVAQCEFDKDAELLTPRRALSLISGAGLAEPRRDFVLFFPPALSALWPLESALRRLPLGAQYAAVGIRS